jgi:hypothetical protein
MPSILLLHFEANIRATSRFFLTHTYYSFICVSHSGVYLYIQLVAMETREWVLANHNCQGSAAIAMSRRAGSCHSELAMSIVQPDDFQLDNNRRRS